MEKKLIEDIAYYQNQHNQSNDANLRYHLTELVTQLSATLDELQIHQLNKPDLENPDKRYQQ